MGKSFNFVIGVPHYYNYSTQETIDGREESKFPNPNCLNTNLLAVTDIMKFWEETIYQKRWIFPSRPQFLILIGMIVKSVKGLCPCKVVVWHNIFFTKNNSLEIAWYVFLNVVLNNVTSKSRLFHNHILRCFLHQRCIHRVQNIVTDSNSINS